MSAVATDARGAAPDPIDSYGYRGTVACAAAGITYRQLDYWARTDLVRPSLTAVPGSGAGRLYNFRDIVILKIVKRLLDTGVSLHNIRAAVAHVHARGSAELEGITLMSDGATVYECTSAEEVVELVHAGQGVFGISVGAVWREVEAVLTQLPGEPVDGAAVPAPTALLGHGVVDELAVRRRSRAV
ncbi:MerR family transcriptional regulator [Actinocrinis puniceicyclus]|uniref:MerR family transcriptional regulator n=1 Tax=Actinocrinis puniceicyclus TaxID=977794 RepID=A0A8J7WP67_9ACTN|nr:MerR family transcriptional regulator [Actinocrinis puniceicyclus]MBS2963019.1 MerR family transcriptional regulator [Actinocrinis puniceicyclus]